MTQDPAAPTTSEPLVDAATKAFVYGYPLVYDLDEVEGFVAGGDRFPMRASFNEFGAARDLLGPETKFVTPNNDTLYLLAMCDVRPTPLVLEVPDTTGRYFVLQLVDAWTNNFAYVGTRTTGDEAGTFVLAPTGWPGAVPDGATVIECPTGVISIVGRVQVHGRQDLDAVRSVQDGFTLTPLDAPASAAEPGLPTPDPKVPEPLAWWERFRVRLAAFPPPEADAPFVAACATLGLTSDPSPFVDADPELAEALVAGEAAGRALIDQLARNATTVNGWRSAVHLFDYNTEALGPGTIDDPAWKIADRTQAYATRAVVAREGLWGNHGYEAAYFLTFVDAEEAELSGEHAYQLRLPSTPPVGAFWSLSMYDVPDYYLVANPIDRYSVGTTTEGLVFGDDGSLTITMQHDRPADPDRAANWLPTPRGAFRPVMRLYIPGPEVIAGDYVLPAIERLS
jgi:hypothetical protein